MNWMIWVISSLALAGCLYDGDQRCGDDQELSEAGVCLCPEGTVPGNSECIPCGANEAAAGDHCVCEVGFVRDPSGACEPADVDPEAPTGQGETCDAQEDCAGFEASYCESVFFHQCLATGCAGEGATPCVAGWICCDFTAIAGVSLCLDQTVLGGNCPAL